MDGGGLRMTVLRRLALRVLLSLRAGLTAVIFAELALCQIIVAWVFRQDLLKLESLTLAGWVGIGLFQIPGIILLRLILLSIVGLNYLTQQIHGVIVTLCIGEKD